MRKFALASLLIVFSLGVVMAGEVVFLGYDGDKKELKVKDGDKEVILKVTEGTTLKFGEKELAGDKVGAVLSKLNDSEKAKGKLKMDVASKDGAATEIKLKGKK